LADPLRHGNQGSCPAPGARHPACEPDPAQGSHKDVDSYSAFLEADRTPKTGLDGYLTARGITELYVCGLALDYCVAWSALDARHFGFATTIIEDACRAIDLNGSLERAWEQLTRAGVTRTSSTAI
jgi:nicotinamidase/pyrazinamidase